MDLSKYNKKELKNLLLTIDIDSHNFNKDELLYLLKEYKKIYKSIYSINESFKYKINNLENKIDINNSKLNSALNIKEVTENELKNIYGRDLTLKERFKGKVYKNKFKRKFKIQKSFDKLKKFFKL